MSIRPFEWHDLFALHRYRRQSVYLHSALVLTRGPMLLPGAMLSSLAPGMGLYTSVYTPERQRDRVIGQVLHPPGAQLAQLTFLTPDKALDGEALPNLLDHLSPQIIERGGFRLLAEVDEASQAYLALREATFAIYARQSIWRMPKIQSVQEIPSGWRSAVESDLIAVRSLYHNVIPGLVQQVEPFTPERLNGLIYRQDGEALAYVELKYGHRGIWAQPFIHPDAQASVLQLMDIFDALPHRHTRSIHVCIRSYQSWLESALADMGAEPGPRQAVMVKHLAIAQKVARPFALPALEGGQPEISAPISSSRNSAQTYQQIEQI